MPKEFRTFPIRVDQAWLDNLEDVLYDKETKHEFILEAVAKLIQNRKEQN